MAGFIIGFDGEKKGAAARIIDFVEQGAIPTVMFGMLQALPNTALWERLEKEERLLVNHKQDINQSTLMNFVPTRPIEEIASEYIEAFWELYDEETFLERTYRCFLKLGAPRAKVPFKWPHWVDVRGVLILMWRQGVKRKSRWKFWLCFWNILRYNPSVWEHYLIVCAHNEHFLEYRKVVRQEIEKQLEMFLLQRAQLQTQPLRT